MTVQAPTHDDVIGKALTALWETVLHEYSLITARAKPEQLKTINVAKAICVANGCDPDLVVMGPPNARPMLGAKGTAVIFAPLQPQWMVFYFDALAAIEAVEKVP